jgi:predicted phage gp36 major capsid-like protein
VELLETLPERVAAVELQLVQLRDEMRGEFSATRAEMRAGDEIQRTLRDEIRAGDEETRRVLRDEIRAGAEETRRYMRILYEDLVARISLLHEGRSRPRKKPDPER